MLLPVTIETEQEEYEAIVDSLSELQKMGFDIEEFGARTFKVGALPAGLRQINAADVIREVFTAVAAVRRGEGGGNRDKRRKALLIDLARVLSAEDSSSHVNDSDSAMQLTAKLFRCDMPYCCPRGRPTLVHVGYSELNRRFSR